MREFVATQVFDKHWGKLNMDDNALRQLQTHLLVFPQSGDVMPGTGGARKIRHTSFETGKSGGVRIIYYDSPRTQKIYLLLCYPKSKQDDLTPEQKKALKKLVEALKGAHG